MRAFSLPQINCSLFATPSITVDPELEGVSDSPVSVCGCDENVWPGTGVVCTHRVAYLNRKCELWNHVYLVREAERFSWLQKYMPSITVCGSSLTSFLRKSTLAL